LNTADGTSNLCKYMDICDACFCGSQLTTSSKSAITPSLQYSEAAHHALIALRCAKHHYLFNFVLNEEYQKEVEMLHPGTKIPLPITISHDIHALYIEFSKHVKE
ncbi:hypothetical protein BDQ17DRAFT_1258804, partial [Cyathus striatus]